MVVNVCYVCTILNDLSHVQCGVGLSDKSVKYEICEGPLAKDG